MSLLCLVPMALVPLHLPADQSVNCLLLLLLGQLCF